MRRLRYARARCAQGDLTRADVFKGIPSSYDRSRYSRLARSPRAGELGRQFSKKSLRYSSSTIESSLVKYRATFRCDEILSDDSWDVRKEKSFYSHFYRNKNLCFFNNTRGGEKGDSNMSWTNTSAIYERALFLLDAASIDSSAIVSPVAATAGVILLIPVGRVREGSLRYETALLECQK